MEKKGQWMSAVRKVFGCESYENRRKHKRSIDLASSSTDNAAPHHSTIEEVKFIEAEIEQNRQAYSVAIATATAAAAEAAAAAANAAAEVVRLTASARYLGKSKEEISAIKIQTAFRGYLARRALRALRGLVRLKSFVGGQSVNRQAATTLKYMQTLTHVQTEIRARRLRMSESNSAITRQIQQKHEKELEKSRAFVGEDWDDSVQSKEQIEASLQHKQEAAIRRERALAYAFTHQQTWRNNPTPTNQTTFMDPNNPHWGWSWLERWMAARPSENGTTKDPNTDRVSINSSSTSRSASAHPNSTKTHNQNSRRPSRQSPSTPKSSKIRPVSPRVPACSGEGDSNSINSVQSERRPRRHSIAGSSVRDDESLASSPAVVHGYMASTESARVRAQLTSPLEGEKVGGSAKKRLSFSGSPSGPRRHSGPSRVEISPMKNISVE